MTNLTDKLAALSEAATQGEWKSIFYDAGDKDHYDHGGPTPGIFSDEADCGVVHWDGFKQKYWSSANGKQSEIEANASFIVALVNAYHTGQLIARPDRDAAIERMARAIAKLYARDDDVAVAQEAWREEATAAYDAMFDGPAPAK